ncbi:hypothetical protein BDP27DRAFT_1434129 [Rhodocollybia butyracea]|uniref:Helicase C-terminal domain-containing protein n=1 Tax=Rhodocollybia butyracea TaxID=206335 RepID=A0A9P5P7K9_9AGAR|nr:hypothetical protein BDP27DRAFT_1434129 [Rhodocollybia butyracea]
MSGALHSILYSDTLAHSLWPISIYNLCFHNDCYHAAWTSSSLCLHISLGFSGSLFHLICRSNEQPNTKIILHTLTSAIGGNEFPQLLPYLNQRHKTVIHSLNPLHRIRLYNSLASAQYNKRTIELLDSDPHCQIVIATKALSLGVHAEELLDSIAIGTADMHDNGKQDGGRARRKEGTIACRIIFTNRIELNKVKNIIEASGEISVATISKVKQTTNTKDEMKRPLDPAKVVFLAEKVC